MRDYSDDPPEVDPDYGVFGDPGSTQATPHPWSSEDQRKADYWRRKREREQRAGADFNSYMISLFTRRETP